MSTPKTLRGFTLIELSIVLVIIGLIVGGVLVGRDLIRAAGIRATISQAEKFSQAVNTFRGKYGYLPGDILPTVARQFGLFTFNDTLDSDCPLNPFGNYIIQSGDYIDGCYLEMTVFWRHLSDAGLVDGTYGSNPGNPVHISTGGFFQSTTNVGIFFPPAKMRDRLFFVAKNWDLTDSSSWITNNLSAPVNYYALIGIDEFQTASNFSASNAITPAEAYNIDAKMDDGMPNTGNVRSYASTTLGGWSATPDPANCLTGGSSATDAAAQYNKNPVTGGNTPTCPLFMAIK